MAQLITIYHGSEKNVENPIFGAGRKNNDFGLGFYCTANEELAKEWAVSSLRDGFSNRYTLDTEYISKLKYEGFDVVQRDRYYVLRVPGNTGLGGLSLIINGIRAGGIGRFFRHFLLRTCKKCMILCTKRT